MTMTEPKYVANPCATCGAPMLGSHYHSDEDRMQSLIESRIVCQREGASLRSADELALILIEDLVSLDAELSPYGCDIVAQAEAALVDSVWINDPDLAEALGDVARQIENTIGDYLVKHDDGYIIVDLRDLDDETIDALSEFLQ